MKPSLWVWHGACLFGAAVQIATQQWVPLTVFAVIWAGYSWMLHDLARTYPEGAEGVPQIRGGGSGYDCTRNRLAVPIVNAVMRLTTPEYRRFVAGSIKYGMNAAADNIRNDAEDPPEWTAATPGRQSEPGVTP